MNNRAAWITVLLLVLLGFAPLLVPFFRGQWARAEYQAFPLLLAAIGFFLYQRWQDAEPVERKSWPTTAVAWLATLSGLVNLALAMFFYSPWLAIIAFVFFAFAFAVSIWQRWAVPGIFGIWLLTCLLVPPPLDRDRMFVAQLQLFSSSVTSKILDGLGILHVLRGNVFELPDKALFVDQACSGIVSLVSIITCIAIYSVWRRRGIVHFLLLIAFGVFWTILMNSLRLATIAIAWSSYQVDWSTGLPHTILALVMFAISAGIVFCADQLLMELLAPIDAGWRERDSSGEQTGLWLMKAWDKYIASPREEEEPFEDPDADLVYVPPRRHEQLRQSLLSWGSPVGWPVLIALGLAGIAQLTVVAPSAAGLFAAMKSSMKRAITLDDAFDPAAGSELKLLNKEIAERDKFDAWGQYSQTFTFESSDGQTFQVSVDFPFGPHWHDLRDCYRGAGWQITDEQHFVMDVELNDSHSPRLGTGTLANGWEADEFYVIRPPELPTKFVVHAAFYADGKIFNRPRGGNLFYDFVTHVAKGRDRQEQADYYQVQVVVPSSGSVRPEHKEFARKLIGTVSEKFRQAIAELPQ